jgi:hypothetical protein
MKNARSATILITTSFLLVSCAPAMNDATACEEVSKYAGEISSTVNKMTENIDDPASLAIFSGRIVEIADEVAALNVRSAEISDVLEDWSALQREIGLFYSDFQVGDEIESALILNDKFQVANNKLNRLCGF